MSDLHDIFMIEIGRPGLPGTGVSSIEKAQIQSDLATLDTRLDTHRVIDLADFALVPRANNHVILWDSALAKWTNRTLAEAIRYVKEDGVVVGEHIDRFDFGSGIEATISGTGSEQANIRVVFGGTGSAFTAARSDHSHSKTEFVETSFAATGSLSSGTRLLREVYTPNLVSDVMYDIEAEAFVSARSSTTGGRFVFRIQLGQGETEGSVRERTFLVETRAPRLCRIRWVFANWASNGNGVRVRVSVAYGTGDPVEILDGDVSATCHPRR